MTSQRDPAHTARNAALYPVDDPPVCERTGCGHYIGSHQYTPRTSTHGPCGACHCPHPLAPTGGAA